jgi:predicted enzyme related to lactoylglutathione lyase
MPRPVHFEIHASDPDAVRAFYTAVFGWRFEQWGEWPGERTLHFFELEDETVWGLTARILAGFLTLLISL